MIWITFACSASRCCRTSPEGRRTGQRSPITVGRWTPPAGAEGGCGWPALVVRLMRTTVSPPTATQAFVVGQASAVKGSGVYSVLDAVNTPCT